MNGEIAIGGVFVPTLLLLATAALALTLLVIRTIAFFGLYRFVAYRALVDLCLYVLVLGLLAWLSPLIGIHP
jgi:hypothetical protein